MLIPFIAGIATTVAVAILFPTRFGMFLFWVADAWSKIFNRS